MTATLMQPTRVHAQPNSWLARHMDRFDGPVTGMSDVLKTIEARAHATQAAGPQPLWAGYRRVENYREVGPDAQRTPNTVRTQPAMGAFFSWLVTAFKPQHIIEIGGAFGVSGMFWLAGLEHSGTGRLTSFEANEVWARFAAENLAAISDRGRIVIGPFEDNLDALPDQIDMAFIDAIHTDEFVTQQLDLVLPQARPGALVILDDIDFSADMARCWTRLSSDPRFVAAYRLGYRVGILELAAPLSAL